MNDDDNLENIIAVYNENTAITQLDAGRRQRQINIGEGPITPEEPETDTYSVTVTCSNCGFDGKADIPKGQAVNDAACPECGCPTVKRKQPKTATTATNLPLTREAVNEWQRYWEQNREENQRYRLSYEASQQEAMRYAAVMPNRVNQQQRARDLATLQPVANRGYITLADWLSIGHLLDDGNVNIDDLYVARILLSPRNSEASMTDFYRNDAGRLISGKIIHRDDVSSMIIAAAAIANDSAMTESVNQSVRDARDARRSIVNTAEQDTSSPGLRLSSLQAALEAERVGLQDGAMQLALAAGRTNAQSAGNTRNNSELTASLTRMGTPIDPRNSVHNLPPQ